VVARRWRCICLTFPTGHKLSSKIVHADAGDNEELNVDIVELPTKRHDDKDDVAGSQHFAAFKVGRKEVKSFKRRIDGTDVAHQSKAAKKREEKQKLKASMATGE